MTTPEQSATRDAVQVKDTTTDEMDRSVLVITTTTTTSEGSSASDAPAAKRQKANVDEQQQQQMLLPQFLRDVISLNILDHEQELHAAYKAAKPYPHGLLQNVFQSNFLNQVMCEIKENSKVNFKESDLFRVYQSIDLANLTQDKHASTMPTVLQLRRVLYSTEWRQYMERLCGLPTNTLTEQVDCACNCHTTGCHLLCHDDVIGTRCLSYIVYLTEADWQVEEGGALELYDSDIIECESGQCDESDSSHRIPKAVPAKTILPVQNTMGYFAVQPGYSFHSVQEVQGDRPRLSLQGWYHAAMPPKNAHSATLQRLKAPNSSSKGGVTNHVRQSEDTEGNFEPTRFEEEEKEKESNEAATDAARIESEKDDFTLSEQDRVDLKEFIQETYITKESIIEIRDQFEEDSSVQLRSFLSDPWIERLRVAIEVEDSERVAIGDPDHYTQGVGNGWSLVGPAHKQRFLCYEKPDPAHTNASVEAVGEILAELKSMLMQSAAFGRYLKSITGLGIPTHYRGRIRRFRPGLDYTVAHYGLLTDISVLDATMCFVAGAGKKVSVDDEVASLARDLSSTTGEEERENFKEVADEPPPDAADVLWQSGDVGGFECYIAADDDEVAVDEYNQDDDTELLNVSACNNTLSLVFRDPGTMRFVKYVSSQAPSSRFDIAMEYQLPPGEDDGS